MAIYAIGDLHLSFSTDKPMDVFGDLWENHADKIKDAWLERVKAEDTVLLVGDTSWALSLEDAKVDLAWIHDLPGQKILIRGNHDYWWATINKMKDMFDDIAFIHNNFVGLDDYAICGSRGWVTPNDSNFTAHDEKIYKRELHRMKLSLDAAVKAGHDRIIVMLHYPPTNDKKEWSDMQALLEGYPVKHVVYGHLHTKYCWQLSLEGKHGPIDYHMVACDYLNFILKKIEG